MAKSTKPRIAALKPGQRFEFKGNKFTFISKNPHGRGTVSIETEEGRFFCGNNSKVDRMLNDKFSDSYTEEVVAAMKKRGRPEIGIELADPIEIAASAAGVFIVTEISGPKAMQGKTATLALNADDAEELVNRLTRAIVFARETAQAKSF